MTYEAWRISYQSSEQAARAAYAECERLRAKIAEMEKQGPAWFIDERGTPQKYDKNKAEVYKCGGLDLLYALPGAQGEEK